MARLRDNTITGTSGNDGHFGTGSKAKNLFKGDAGNGLVSGRAGRDEIYGGTGSDPIRDGGGHDECCFNANGKWRQGKINDFLRGEDKIRIVSDKPLSFDDLKIVNTGTGRATRSALARTRRSTRSCCPTRRRVRTNSFSSGRTRPGTRLKADAGGHHERRV